MSARPASWHFRLYVSDDVESLDAEQTVRRTCEKHLAGNFDVEVIRVARRDRRAPLDDDVLIVPSCVRLAPAPIKTVVAVSSFEQLLI